MNWTVGVDIGGTFTDFFALNESTGYVYVTKRPSTGLNVVGAIELAKEMKPEQRVVTLACDSELKYLGGHIYA